ncbi:MAG: MFS transporter [Candidatus Promineifilaceae bacterium]
MRRSPSPRLILAVISFGVFVAADDLTVVSTMLRQIIFDLQIPLPDGLNQAAWIVNAYLIAYVVVMPFMGRVSDILGRRQVYVAALGLFLLGSIWVPFAPNLPTFLAGRVVTALGGGAMVPVGMAIIGDIYAPRRRATALGVLGAIDTAGWVWGPLYGALLVRFLDWRWQFYLNIPLALLGMAAAWWALRDLPPPARRSRLDWRGVALLTVGLVALNVALLNRSDIQSVSNLTQLAEGSSFNSVPLWGLAAAALLLFAWVERRQPDPLIDWSLFRLPNFTPAILVNFLVGGVLIIAMVNVPLFVNVVEIDLAQAALDSGRLLSSMTLAMAVMAYVGGLGTERWGYRGVASAGIVACIAGFLLMGLNWQADTPYSQMAWQLAILGAGFGLVTAPVGAAVINAAPADQRGIAASLVIVLRLLGMSVGLAALTSWGLHRFNVLRVEVALPPMTDPSFGQALADGLTSVTVQVLAETFVVSAGIAGLALVVSFWLRVVSLAHGR